MLLLLLIIVLVFALGGLPQFGYHQYGWGPSGLGFVIVLILVVLLLTGRV